MSKAEERALEAFPIDIKATQLFGTYDVNLDEREAFRKGYEQAEKDIIIEVERWLKAEFHHRNCWNAEEFCVSLRTYFGIEK